MKKENTKYNREFETIDTEQKAYVLGYFFGDGCIHKRKSKNKNCNIYSCSIISGDFDIINKIKSNFNFFNVLSTKKKYKTLFNANSYFYNDLVKNGVFPQKSTTNKNLLKMPNIPEELIPHFIRGLYDSDGGYYIYGSLLETFFCSTSKTLIIEVQNWFSKNNIFLNLNMRDNRKTPIYYLRSKSNKTCRKFYELIHKNSTIFMDRKRNVFKKANLDEGFIKRSNYFANKKSTQNQKERLNRDYKLVIEKFKDIEEIENPSVCCNYHTIESGKSYKKGIVRPLFLCLNCGKKSVLNKVLLKQDELTGNPLEF